MQLSTYSNVRDARSALNTQDATVTTGDDYLLDMLRFVTARLDALCAGLEFMPRIQTRYYDTLGLHISDDDSVLFLDRPLLEITTVVNGDGDTLVNGTDFYTAPRIETPYARFRLLADSGHYWGEYTDETIDAISIEGVWGQRGDYNEAWFDSGDTVQDNPLSSSATSITVADADGADIYARSPRFSPGQLLKIEDEYIELLAVDTDTDVLTVRRGVRGSTAASHIQTTAIDIWEPEPAIQRAALVWAAYLYARRGAFENTSFDGMATTTWPQDAPNEVMAVLLNTGWLATSRKPF